MSRRHDNKAKCVICDKPCRSMYCIAHGTMFGAKTYFETDEDLDKLVAEQYKCLPDWWDEETFAENPPDYNLVRRERYAERVRKFNESIFKKGKRV